MKSKSYTAKKFHVVEHLGNDGVRIEAFGFEGKMCEKVTAQITASLAGEVKSVKKKPEYDMKATTKKAQTLSA